jgi:hypothetical protein
MADIVSNKLYSVSTLVRQYHGCKDVPFIWFRSGVETRTRSRQTQYVDLIDNYDLSNGYAEMHVEELFNEGEAKQLKGFLDSVHGDDGPTTISEAQLPLQQNTMGVGAIAVGGGDDFYLLHKEPEYSLPFDGQGYFNLVGCDLLDGSGVYHHRLFILFPDGRFRMQTNQEAAADAMPPGDDCGRGDALPF